MKALMADLMAVCPYGIIRTNRKTFALQRVERFVLVLFPLKTPPKWGSGEGVKKQGCTLRTNFWKFWTTNKEVKMGFWGITMRESDYGLDLLGAIVNGQLKALDFSTFKVADALEVIKADIMEEISWPIAAALRRTWFTISARISHTTSHRGRF